MLGQGRQDKMTLHQGKGIADTNPRPTPKGDIGVTGQALLGFGRETFGIKALRLWEVIRTSMHGIGTNGYQRSRRQVVISNRYWAYRLARKSIGRRVKTYRLFENLQGIGQVG